MSAAHDICIRGSHLIKCGNAALRRKSSLYTPFFPLIKHTPADFNTASFIPLLGRLKMNGYNALGDRVSLLNESNPSIKPAKRASRRQSGFPKESGRYACKFKHLCSCDKTFTTSGHASRHSKIHTTPNAVQCTFPGCQKRFTRTDNMRQHFATHEPVRESSKLFKPSRVLPLMGRTAQGYYRHCASNTRGITTTAKGGTQSCLV